MTLGGRQEQRRLSIIVLLVEVVHWEVRIKQKAEDLCVTFNGSLVQGSVAFWIL